MNPSPEFLYILLSAVVNAAATWGVVSTKLAWLRRDVDRANDRIDAMERRPPIFPPNQC